MNPPTITITVAETVRLLGWAKDCTDALRRHVSWLQDLEGKDLPGAEIAVAEVRKDIKVNTELTLRLFEHRNSLCRDAEQAASETASGAGAAA
jgi:hypothetical protein